MATRRGEYGIQNLFFYVQDDGEYTTVIEQLGARGVTREVEQEITSFYADNRVHLQIPGVKNISGEITTYQMEDDVYTELLGFNKQPNGGFTDGGTSKRFGMAFVKKVITADGDEQFKLVVMYDCIATEPNEEITTSEDAVELTELTFAYTSKVSDVVKDSDGNYVSYFFATLPVGTSEEDVITLLQAGIPLPTDEVITSTPAVATFGTDGTPTVDTLSGVYSYVANDDLISDSAMNIYLSTDLTTSVDTITPLVEGSDVAWSFTGLTADTAYTIKIMQGTTELATESQSTTAAVRTAKAKVTK